jgi:hypothetical protein
LQGREIEDVTLVFERDDGRVSEKSSKATTGEDGHSVVLLVRDAANQPLHKPFDLLLILDKSPSPVLSVFQSIINSLKLILGKEANAFPLLLIVPFGIEIKR